MWDLWEPSLGRRESGRGIISLFFFFSIVAIFFNSESIALFSGVPGTTVSTVARFELPTLTYFEPELCQLPNGTDPPSFGVDLAALPLENELQGWSWSFAAPLLHSILKDPLPFNLLSLFTQKYHSTTLHSSPVLSPPHLPPDPNRAAGAAAAAGGAHLRMSRGRRIDASTRGDDARRAWGRRLFFFFFFPDLELKRSQTLFNKFSSPIGASYHWS